MFFPKRKKTLDQTKLPLNPVCPIAETSRGQLRDLESCNRETRVFPIKATPTDEKLRVKFQKPVLLAEDRPPENCREGGLLVFCDPISGREIWWEDEIFLEFGFGVRFVERYV